MTTQAITPQRFATYGQYAKNWMKENEIKVQPKTIENGQYNRHFVYINRIANGNKPKFRVLEPGKDKVKNCMLIAFNPDRYTRAEITAKVKALLPLIAHFSHGSCHRFVTCDIISQLLSGVYDRNGRTNKNVLY
jgi:hypothetical protein